jgi:hypothetical protein
MNATPKSLDEEINHKLKEWVDALKDAGYWHHCAKNSIVYEVAYTQRWANAMTKAKFARIEIARLMGIRGRLFPHER